METIASSITELELAHGERVFIAPTGVKDIVSIEGSVLGGWNMLARDKSEVASLASDLLDAGTTKKNKEVIRGALAERGASLAFSSTGDRTTFSGSCLPEDLSAVLKIAAECLAQANFPVSELKVTKERAVGDFEEEKSDTRTQASSALSRLIFDSKHVNYSETTAEQLQSALSVTRSDLVNFRNMLGYGGLVLALTGDVQPASVRKSAESAFGILKQGTKQPVPKQKNTKPIIASEKYISISDKANIDTYLGSAIPLTYNDSLYLPFVTMLSMLGGRGLSTGHLMRTIRERDGLTYGIYATPIGFGDEADGGFRIWATFSPATFNKAVDATRKEIKVFLTTGIQDKVLQTKKDEMTGSYLVGLSTTRGLANMLHKIAVEGKSLSYIDEYPDLIRSISLADIHTVADFIQIKKLSLAAAGTFIKGS
jgi:zinc protease